MVLVNGHAFLKESDEFLGRAGFSVMDNGEVEVGYGFLREYWGKGYATESLNALLNWAFSNLTVPRIIAFTNSNNIVSIKILKKCGMELYKQEFIRDALYEFYYIINSQLRHCCVDKFNVKSC
ncbi:MAG: GNAT family N-acetyltransferase [Alphaproteobacteria bacterium]